jgi:hypothetical protein
MHREQTQNEVWEIAVKRFFLRCNAIGGERIMPKYVIERELPGAGKLTSDELRDISQKSNKVICDLGPEIRWQQR